MRPFLRKIRPYCIGIVVGLILAGGIAAAQMEFDLSRILPFEANRLWLMKQTRSLLETYHVDGDEAREEDKLFYGAVKGMVSAWGDPYSRFVDPEEIKEEEIEMQGEYGGLGIYIGQRDGRTLVISPIEGTPADRAGLKPQDEIVKVNDEVVVGWQINDVVKLLRGDPGTKVTIWVRREGENQLLDFELVREIIQIKSVRYEKIDDLGYVRIAQFTQRTTQEMEEALSELLPVQGMVLDLRNDPGGLLNAAVEVSDMFLDGGLIVGMRGRVREANEEYYAKSGFLYDGPVIALINEGSASASEIVAGALRDNGRATLVGTKSFGKGSVQTLFRLPDESGLFITIARYYTPAGTEIDKVGLQPDITVEGEMVKEREKDVQLQRAISELRERIASQEAMVAR